MTCGGCSGAVEKVLNKIKGEYLLAYTSVFQPFISRRLPT